MSRKIYNRLRFMAVSWLDESTLPISLGNLLLGCSRNILVVRSESGRTIGWAQAHFFVAAGGDEHSTGLGRGVFK